MGVLVNASQGVWETTERGRDAAERELWRDYSAKLRAERREKKQAAKAAGADVEPETDDGDTDDWPEELLQVMLRMTPDAFERLAHRLLRAAGFINTKVTVRSGDGGIDGMGVYRVSLVSFPGVLSVQALQRQRRAGEGSRFSRRDGRSRRQRPTHHHRHVHVGASREANRDGAPRSI